MTDLIKVVEYIMRGSWFRAYFDEESKAGKAQQNLMVDDPPLLVKLLPAH